MGGVVILADNLMSGLYGQYPGHTISAEEEPASHEAWRVGVSRRSHNYATASTANSAWYLTSAFDRLRAHNCVILDRGHNLAGETFEWRSTADAVDFSATYETILDITLPTYSMPGSIDNALGVVTEEGAWLKRYDTRVGTAVRLYVDAMGAGLSPQIPGLWAGLAVELGEPGLPHDEDSHELIGQITMESESGWIGRGRRTRRRRGEIRIPLNDITEYDQLVRHQIVHLFGDGIPMWVVPNADQAERAFLATRATDLLTIPQPPNDGYREVILPFVEYQPQAI